MPIPRNPAMPISVWLEGHFIVTDIIHLIFTLLFLVSQISNLLPLVNIIQYLNKVLQLLSLIPLFFITLFCIEQEVRRRILLAIFLEDDILFLLNVDILCCFSVIFI